jgi:spectinomycin phosphotransferase
MLEPPDLPDSTIRATVQERFGIAVASLAFLAIGNDAASFVYRIDAEDGASYFLKGRTGAGFRAPSLVVPRFLAEQGVPHILSPLATLDGHLWVSLDDFVLTLYPFLEARTATEAGLSEQQWRILGETLRQIHGSTLPPELKEIVPRETFSPSRRRVVDQVETLIAGEPVLDPIQREFVASWRARQDEIRFLVERADTLGEQLRAVSRPMVLCHADLHTWNVLVDRDGQMWIVDWDEVVLAPKERDLMFVIGGIARGLVSPDETARFLRGYGEPPVDMRALAYYRYAWAVQDIAAYAEEILFSPALGEQSRRAALQYFTGQFTPGNIVDIARETSSTTPPSAHLARSPSRATRRP